AAGRLLRRIRQREVEEVIAPGAMRGQDGCASLSVVAPIVEAARSCTPAPGILCPAGGGACAESVGKTLSRSLVFHAPREQFQLRARFQVEALDAADSLLGVAFEQSLE